MNTSDIVAADESLTAQTEPKPIAEPNTEQGDALPDTAQVNPDSQYTDLPANLAGNKELTKKALETIQSHYQNFRRQTGRKRLLDICKMADAMARVSKVREQTSTEDPDTLSNVASTSFYESLRTITAGLNGMMLYNNAMPVQYELRRGSDDFNSDTEAQRILDQQNALLWYTRDEGEWDSIDKQSNYFGNKYPMEIQSIVWDLREEERVERVPTEFDDKGKPTKFEFQRKKRKVSDYPKLQRHNIRDTWFDLQIDSDPGKGKNCAQKQHCIISRFQEKLSELRDNDEYLNTDKLTDAQLYGPGKNDGETMLEDQQENAGEDRITLATGDYDCYWVWVRLPITESNGVFKWDDKAVPRWYETVWSGDVRRGGETDCICLQLRKNPYHHCEVPFNIEFSHMDDKGAVRIGYATVAECLYGVDKTLIDQMIDSNTLRIKSPFVLEEGNVRGKTFKFRGPNQVFWVRAGMGRTAITKLDVPSVLSDTMPLLQTVNARFKSAMGTMEPISGGPIGGRASATQAQNTLEQAMKPAIEDAKYRAEQRYHWQARIVAALWRQLGDPERVLTVTYNNQLYEIKPTELYGDFRTRIVSVGQFEADVLEQQTMNDFAARVLPTFAPMMGQEGLKKFGIALMKSRKIRDAETFFGNSSTKDAERVAWYENIAILQQGVQDIPEVGENDAAHLSIHEPYLERYLAVMPTDQQNEANLRNMNVHILIHKQHQTQTQPAQGATPQGGQPGQPGQPGQQGPNQYGVGAEGMAGSAPMLPGEMMGDQMGAASQGGAVS